MFNSFKMLLQFLKIRNTLKEKKRKLIEVELSLKWASGL